MPNTAQEIYQQQVLSMDDNERLRLAALIINDISKKTERNDLSEKNGSIRELFGSVSLGHPTGADNAKIDADLAREYGSTHDGE